MVSFKCLLFVFVIDGSYVALQFCDRCQASLIPRQLLVHGRGGGGGGGSCLFDGQFVGCEGDLKWEFLPHIATNITCLQWDMLCARHTCRKEEDKCSGAETECFIQYQLSSIVLFHTMASQFAVMVDGPITRQLAQLSVPPSIRPFLPCMVNGKCNPYC